MIPTLVTPVRRRMSRTGPAITWEDCRADDLRRRAPRRLGGDRLYRLHRSVGGRPLPAADVTCDCRGRPRGGAAAHRRLLGAKDYLFAWLTGELATDPSTAAGYRLLRAGDRRVDRRGPGRGRRRTGRSLPDCARPCCPPPAPPLRAEAATRLGLPAGLPVVPGRGRLGARRARPGRPRAGRRRLRGRHEHRHPGHRRPAGPRPRSSLPDHAAGRASDGWGVEMDLLTTGSAVRGWRACCARPDRGRAGRAGGERRARRRGPVLLPYLAPGEQGALWDPSLRGAVVGLTSATAGRTLARALVDGIVLESAPLPGRARRDRRAAGPARWPAAAAPTRPSAPTWPTPRAGWSRCRRRRHRPLRPGRGAHRGAGHRRRLAGWCVPGRRPGRRARRSPRQTVGRAVGRARAGPPSAPSLMTTGSPG